MTQVGKWNRLSRALRYQNPWIKVYHDEVTTPGGDKGIYGVVEFQSTAVGVIAEKDGEILMVNQFRYPLERQSLELPEGGCPAGENLLAGAQRELLEETGFRTSNWKKLLEMDLSNSVTNESAVIYLAEDIEKCAEPQLESTEADLLVEWYTLEQLIQMIDKGEIRDAITVAGLLAYSRLRNTPQG